MNKLTAFMKKFANGVERYGQHRVRNELLAMSDRQLTDIGYSRDLLRKGVDFWPWRLEQTTIQSEAHAYTANVETTLSSANQEKAA